MPCSWQFSLCWNSRQNTILDRGGQEGFWGNSHPQDLVPKSDGIFCLHFVTTVEQTHVTI
jgi:hypothetical protein